MLMVTAMEGAFCCRVVRRCQRQCSGELRVSSWTSVGQGNVNNALVILVGYTVFRCAVIRPL